MPNPDRKLLAALKAAEKFTQAMQEVARILPEELPEGAEFYVGNREAFSFVVPTECSIGSIGTVSYCRGRGSRATMTISRVR